jgi:hypothetical protein
MHQPLEPLQALDRLENIWLKSFGTPIIISYGSKASKFSALKARSKTLKKQKRKYLPECGLSARNSKLLSREAVLTLSILQLEI